MDEDTIFPALSGGELILGKYVHSECRMNLQTIVILTNYRLLIRRKYTIVGCIPRSSYTSINLDTIDRVDEEPANSSIRFVFTMLTMISISIILLAFDIQLKIIVLNIITPIVIVLSIVTLIWRYLTDKHYLLVVCGSFGSETFKLNRELSRDLEGKLIEMSFQTRLYFSHSNNGKPSQQTLPSAPRSTSDTQPYASNPFTIETEKNDFIHVEQTPRLDVNDDDDDF